jgi:hypothetical protein
MLNARMLFGAASFLALAAALPATGPDDDDFACYTSSVDYSSTSRQYYEDHIYTTSISTQVWSGDSNPSHCFIAARPKQTLYY